MSSRETRVGLILALSLLVVATLGVTARSGSPRSPTRSEPARLAKRPRGPNAGDLLVAQGKQTFRFDTFGDEAFWGGALRLHEAVATLSPNQALGLGLKVDSDALPERLQKQLKHGRVDLNDPAVTLALLKLNAVVGVTGFFNADGSQLQSLGIQCALCHSVVDDSLAPGVGRRLDGWANRDLNVGAIVAAAPSVKPFADALRVDEATVRAVLESWGPGRFDAELILDGKAFRPDGKSASVLIPPAFGQAGINLQTWTGWGTVTYWNALVANLEMHGQGFFEDQRLNNPIQFPVAAANGFFLVQSPVDRITPKLAGLHDYQLSLPAPTPPPGSFDRNAAARGQVLFNGKANCASCHVPPLFTEPGFNLHLPAEIGIDDFQANRSPTFRYRTSPLRGLWTHTEGGFYHDGRFADLNEVINHYNTFFGLGLTEPESADLVEYLKSL